MSLVIMPWILIPVCEKMTPSAPRIHSVDDESFVASASAARPADDEEYEVMFQFARHSSRCTMCADPVEAFYSSGSLCDSGNKYACDLAQYIYSKNGKAYSVVDRQHCGEKNIIEVPQSLSVVKTLCRAVDEGLTLRLREGVRTVDQRSEKRPQERRERLAHTYKNLEHRPGSSREKSERSIEIPQSELLSIQLLRNATGLETRDVFKSSKAPSRTTSISKRLAPITILGLSLSFHLSQRIWLTSLSRIKIFREQENHLLLSPRLLLVRLGITPWTLLFARASIWMKGDQTATQIFQQSDQKVRDLS